MDEVKWLIAQEVPSLRRYARALLRDPVHADDLVQDCLERALNKRHQWRREASIRHWLLRVLYRLYLNDRRYRERRPLSVPLEEAGAPLAAVPRQESRMECQDMVLALEQLPPEQRSAILLIALEGMPYDEAARVLCIPIGTLRSRLSRGREALRAAMTGPRRQPKLRAVK